MSEGDARRESLAGPVRNGKSPVLAFVLTFLFGPVGLFYSTVVGGLFMLPMALIVGFVTQNVGFLLVWPVCIVWGVVAAMSAEPQEAAIRR